VKNLHINHERLLKVILAPYISEKATYLGENNSQSVFRVSTDATKTEIKAAIELLWNEHKVKVSRVQTINVKGKKKRFGRYSGRRSDWKKAIIMTENNQELNFADFASITEVK